MRTYCGGGDAESGGNHPRPDEGLEDAVEVLYLGDVHLGELVVVVELAALLYRVH